MMNQKFVFIFFVTVLYNGVTYSSPVNEQKPDIIVPEEKPPTDPIPTTEHMDKNNGTASAANQQVKVPQVLSNSSQPIKDAHIQIATENTTLSLFNVTEKSVNKTMENKTTPVGNKTTLMGNKTMEVPAETSAGPSTVTPGIVSTTASIAKYTNVTTFPSVNSNQTITPSTTAPSTTTSTATSTALSTTPSTKLNVTTDAPMTSKKDNVVEHNTPAPVQEKHFDGQSFIGGMALTIGLTAIGFIAFKYYKSGKIDMNYRTL